VACDHDKHAGAMLARRVEQMRPWFETKKRGDLAVIGIGILRQVGFKFGRWLDLAFYQLVLPTPAQPTERTK
jgi:hypothetical protein